MKKIISSILVILFVLAGLEVIGISNDKTIESFHENDFKGLFDDISAYRYQTARQGKVPSSMWSIDAVYTNSESVNENLYFGQIRNIGFDRDYPIGEIIW